MAGRSYKTEAVVLRSLRLGEADRVLHLYTLQHGRIGAVAKGVRKTKSRFGARLEPLSYVELQLHRGAGELETITGVELIRAHSRVREDSYRLGIGLIGAEATLRLFGEQESNPRAFGALLRFLELLDDEEPRIAAREPSVDPLALSFQLKLLWLAGYSPHLDACAECGSPGPFVGYSPRAGGIVCCTCGEATTALSQQAVRGMQALLRTPLADAGDAPLSERSAREMVGVIAASYEFHGGFRLRTLSASR